MVVGDAREVPRQPGDGIGVFGGPEAELLGCQAVEGAAQVFVDSVEGVDDQVLAVHCECNVPVQRRALASMAPAAHCEHARPAGAVIEMEPEDQFYGARTYRAKDVEGHVWTFSQTIREVSREE